MLDDRIAFVVGECAASIIGVGDRLAAAGARVGGDDHIFVAGFESGRVVPVDDGAAGEDPIAVLVRIDGNGELASNAPGPC